jgi:uncharacterized protein (TIGR02145 family)
LEKIFRFPIFILIAFLILALSGCSKVHEYKYFDSYTGNWQFRTYQRSWGGPYYGGNYDTIYYFGSISRRDDNRGIQINYSTGITIAVWIEENGTIFKDGSILGSTNGDTLQFSYTRGTISYGTEYTVYGVRKAASDAASQEPTIVTKSATGVTLAGSMLRGVVNAGSSSCDLLFEYGLTENYGSTAPAIPDKAECDMDINAKVYINGLEPSSNYHFRIKAVTSSGTIYGNDMTFVTSDYLDQVTDIDGNVYKTIRIGKQIWIAENLKTTKYRNGDPITFVINTTTLIGLTEGAFCYYNLDATSNKDLYGALYNYYAVADSRDLCPAGWHIPCSSELSDMVNYLYPYSAGRLKESGVSHWITPNSGADNSSGFTALPGGNWGYASSQFSGMGYNGRWWSTTEAEVYYAKCLMLSYLYDYAWMDIGSKGQFMSIRCIKD